MNQGGIEMNTLKAEKRDLKVKAKRLRREGFVPGNLCGGNLEDSIPLQFTDKDANRFIKGNKKGARLTLDVDSKKYDVMLKDVDYNSINNQIMSIDFQALIADEKILGTAQLVVINDEKTNLFIHQELNELTYKAFPADIVEKIEIDITKFPEGESIYVKDLDIFKNEKIEVIAREDELVVNISEHMKKPELDDDVESTETVVEAGVEN